MNRFLKGVFFCCVLLSLSAYAEEDAMQILDRMRVRIEKEEAEKAKLAVEAKPKTEAEKLELTRKKAMNKLDFYERVVRSVAREEAEVAEYYEIMGEEKARPSIMDEQKAEVTEQTSQAETSQEEIQTTEVKQ